MRISKNKREFLRIRRDLSGFARMGFMRISNDIFMRISEDL